MCRTTSESRTRAPPEKFYRGKAHASLRKEDKGERDVLARGRNEQEERKQEEQETKSAGILTKTEGLPMAGASRRVSPSGWLWNVCPRSPPRHRVAAAPSLTVVTAAAAVVATAVSLRKARQGAAAAARTQGLVVVRPCVSPQTLHHRLYGTLRRILRGWTAEKSGAEEGAGGGGRDQV